MLLLIIFQQLKDYVMNQYIQQIHNLFIQALIDTKDPSDRINRRFFRYYIEKQLINRNLSTDLCRTVDISKLTINIKSVFGKEFTFKGTTYLRDRSDYFWGMKLPTKMQKMHQFFIRYFLSTKRASKLKQSNRKRSKSRQTSDPLRSSSPVPSRNTMNTIQYREQYEGIQSSENKSEDKKKWCSKQLQKSVQVLREASQLQQRCNKYMGKYRRRHTKRLSRQEAMQKKIKALIEQNRQLKSVHNYLTNLVLKETERQKNMLSSLQWSH